MMRNVLSIILYVIAGFFFYLIGALGFMSGLSNGIKWAVVAGFSAPAFLLLAGGLALTNFRNWKRTTGIVLLSSAAAIAIVAFTFVCLMLEEEFVRLAVTETLAMFSDYLGGFTLLAGLTVSGLLLVRAGRLPA